MDATATKASEEQKQTTTTGGGQYVNEGLERWEAARKEWSSKDSRGRGGGGGAVQANRESDTRDAKKARSVDVDAIIESIFSSNGDARLPHPVPLTQMIDLLVDFWEADGLYD